MPFRSHVLSRKMYVLTVIAVIAVLVLAYFAVVYKDVLEDLTFPWSPKRVEWEEVTDPNLKVRGVIEELKLNYRTNGGLAFHRFPAYFVLNSTVTLWTNENSWSNRTVVQVGYDYEEVAVHSFSVGIYVEVSGYWLSIMDHGEYDHGLYDNMIVVGPLVYGSYVKPLEP